MLGMNKLASLPRAPRVVIGLSIVIFTLWCVVKLTVYGWVETGIGAFSEDNDIEYESTFFRLNGDFGINNVHVVHSVPDGRQPEYQIDRLVVHTPGFLWLLRNSWFKTSKLFPDDFGVTLENARNTEDNDQTPGNYSNLPYDAMGCGVDQLTPAHFRSMGLPPPRRDFSGTLERIDDGTSKLHFALTTRDVGTLAMDFEIGYQRPVKWFDSLQTFVEAPITKASMSMTDLGFIEARNRYCAKEGGIARSAFGEYHMQAMAARLHREQLNYSPETLLRYRQFAEHGGELQILSTHVPRITMGQFMNLNRVQKMQAFSSQIRRNDGPLAPFVVQPDAPVAVASGSPPPTAPTLVTPSMPVVTATPAAAETTPASTVAAPVTGGVIAYRKLEHMIGAHIEVNTTMGTVRRGTLIRYSPYISNMHLDPEEGGFSLTIPADTVIQVRQIPSVVHPEGSMTARNAQAH